ncbi:MAG TPA: SsrA-binding protein SmpB [Acidobacteriota bacterium]|nr:SsrA-binding protein SmpB [Acidobacteriota bacterium]HOT00176.1 SsrA-binding protein SmpB [Acidobacteriota bacterium]HQF85928.1 SsrA-binding protein SmpB [Acidobacteriota bacterium]HQG90828.1 SsrA-binding protein SmpB [Acidobacteriota bacterium]HQK86183.1 SsrA-binding protein SmpB [Acidobacteriota bacterium]
MTVKLIARNKKAFHDYEVVEKIEAGLALQGTEVKALREGRINLKDSHAKIRNGEMWLVECHISPYTHGNIHNHDPIRPRKLLLHGSEIRRLIGKVVEKGMTLIPLSVYFNPKGRVKVELGLCRGKKTVDKRRTEQERTEKREIEKIMKNRGRE